MNDQLFDEDSVRDLKKEINSFSSEIGIIRQDIEQVQVKLNKFNRLELDVNQLNNKIKRIESKPVSIAKEENKNEITIDQVKSLILQEISNVKSETNNIDSHTQFEECINKIKKCEKAIVKIIKNYEGIHKFQQKMNSKITEITSSLVDLSEEQEKQSMKYDKISGNVNPSDARSSLDFSAINYPKNDVTLDLIDNTIIDNPSIGKPQDDFQKFLSSEKEIMQFYLTLNANEKQDAQILMNKNVIPMSLALHLIRNTQELIKKVNNKNVITKQEFEAFVENKITDDDFVDKLKLRVSPHKSFSQNNLHKSSNSNFEISTFNLNISTDDFAGKSFEENDNIVDPSKYENENESIQEDTNSSQSQSFDNNLSKIINSKHKNRFEEEDNNDDQNQSKSFTPNLSALNDELESIIASTDFGAKNSFSNVQNYKEKQDQEQQSEQFGSKWSNEKSGDTYYKSFENTRSDLNNSEQNNSGIINPQKRRSRQFLKNDK